jgi:hypothetical protein
MVFVDAVGGGLAAIGAGVATLLGIEGAIAATSAAKVDVPSEVKAVLEEIGATLPTIHGGDAIASPTDAGAEVVFLGGEQAKGWSVALHSGEGELERLSAARIARDRMEKRLEAIKKS